MVEKLKADSGEKKRPKTASKGGGLKVKAEKSSKKETEAAESVAPDKSKNVNDKSTPATSAAPKLQTNATENQGTETIASPAPSTSSQSSKKGGKKSASCEYQHETTIKLSNMCCIRTKVFMF